MTSTNEQLDSEIQTELDRNPLKKADDYILLMQFFNNSIMGYSGLAQVREEAGDKEAAKYYEGVADGIKHCMRNIYALKENKFLDPIV